MNIDDFLKSKEITDKELSDNFNLVKTLEIDAVHTKGCFNCGNEHNKHSLQSESWTMVQHCWACDSINFVLVSDRMAGNYTDTVKVYQNKE